MQEFYDLFNIDRGGTKDEILRKLHNLQRVWLVRTNSQDITCKQEAQDMMQILRDARDKLLIETKEDESDDNVKTEVDKEANADIDLAMDIEEAIDITTEPIVEEPFEIDEEADALSLIDQANNLIDYGRFEDAIIVATRATELDGLNEYAWSTLAQANYQLGDIENAISKYKRAIEINPIESKFFYELGIIYAYGLKDMQKALECVENCFQRDSKHFWCRLLNGFIQRKIRMFDNSVAILEELNLEEPNNLEIRNQLAWSYNHKAFSLLHYNKKDDNYHIISPETIDPAASYFEKAINITESESDKAWFTQKYDWVIAGRESKFLAKNPLYYIIPAFGFFMMFKDGKIMISFVFLIVLMAIIYASLEPQWKINRKKNGI